MPPEWIDQLPKDIQLFIEQIKDLPDFPRHLAKLADILNQRAQKQAKVAQRLAYQAWQLAPQDPMLRHATYWGVKNFIPSWHLPIINDPERIGVYAQALEQSVRPHMSVLEIGAGSGILSMIAARAGARHVYACEMEPRLAQVAQENINKNGLADRITLLVKKSTDLQIGTDLPEPVDLLVSEIVDNALLGEEVLPTLEDAQARLVKPQAVILPTRMALCGALIGGAPWTKFCRASSVNGFDLSALNQLAPPKSIVADHGLVPDDLLSEIHTLFEFDFSQPAHHPASSAQLDVSVRQAGTLDGLLQWIRLDFGQGLVFENRPPTHYAQSWTPVLHVFATSRSVAPGDVVKLHLEHNQTDFFAWPLD